MLNRIIHWSLQNRITVLVLSAMIMILGVLTLIRMDVDIFPDLNAPTVTIMTEAPGYAAEEVERVVTYPIETSMNGSAGVRNVRSSSSPGLSTVKVEFDWNTDIYKARQIVSERLVTVSEELPANVNKPVMGPQSSILGEMFIIGLTADSTSMLDLRTVAERIIRPRLLALGGVSQVSVIGGDPKEYQIRLNPGLMSQYGVSLDEVRAAAQNLNANSAGGIVYQYGNEYLVKGETMTSDVSELAKATVRSDERGIVTIGDVATVEIASATPRIGLASVETKPAVIITVTKQPDTGTIDLTEKIDAELANLRRTIPADIQMHTNIFRQSDFIDNSISNLQGALLEGALFVIIVLFIFLMNVRTTLISVVALPMSILVTILILKLLGYTVNTMSLGGIAIAIGSLVDDAIVDVENVFKRLRENHQLPEGERKPAVKVVFDASSEVRTPILQSTLVIIASFLPLFFLTGMEGRLLIPLGVSFIVALIASTIIALTVTPVLCCLLLGGKRSQQKLDKVPKLTLKLKEAYSRSVHSGIRRRKGVVITAVALFAVALVLFFTLGRSFLPGFNEGSMTINVSTVPGVSLYESDKIGREAESIIMSVPEVQTVARKTGRAELDEHSLGANVSEFEVPYKLDKRSRREMVAELREKLNALPGVNVEIGQPISHRIDAMLSGTEAQIAVKIFGDDLNTLFTLGNQLKAKIKEDVPGIVDVNVEQQIERPEISIRPDRERLAANGITMDQFNSAINVALGGEVVSTVYEDGQPYDVTLIADTPDRETIDALSKLSIDGAYGKVPLDMVATVSSVTGPNTINRENVKRRIVVSANLSEGDLRGAVNKIDEVIQNEMKLPEGYYVTYGGQFESEAAASHALLWSSLFALLVILMLLYSQYHNFTQTLIILSNMPLAIIGGIFILVITGGELNIPAIIGFISLMGISVRNGMLLMTRYNRLAAQGEPLEQRIVHGSSDRLMPIIMTALTSALALIPLAVNGDQPGNEIQSPMAVVILGGLLSSTVLNMYVVPALYYYSEKRRLSKTAKEQ